MKSSPEISTDRLIPILQSVKDGTLSPSDAARELSSDNHLSNEPLNFAELDYDRAHRTSIPEVIYCEGKTPEQIAAIASRLGRGDVAVDTGAPFYASS